MLSQRMGRRYGTALLPYLRDTSRERPEQEMPSVQAYCLVFMKTGHSKSPCLPVPVRQLPACRILLVRMDYALSTSALPLQKNLGLGKTKRKKNFSSLSLGLFSVIKGSIL